MAGSDAIEIVEDWISEHYFTTDAKNESFQAQALTRRKQWDERDTESAATDAPQTPRSRFTKARAELAARLASLAGEDDATPTPPTDDVRGLYAEIRQVLGYATGEFLITTHDGVRSYNTTGVTADAPLIIVEAIPVATHESLFDKGMNTLLTPYSVDESTTFSSVPRLLSHLFLTEDGPEFALVLAGRWALIAERARWAEGRYLAVNLQTVCERNDAKRGGEIDRALTCLSAESLAPDADGNVWWASVLQDSVQHTVGVSKDLREGVRSSIEIIANEVVARRKLQGLPPLPQGEAQPLAKQALRFLYRILFLLYAEASPEMAVLPAEAPEYEAGYGLNRLRELTLVEITSADTQRRTHLYDSLALLFRLVDQGHSAAKAADSTECGSTDGLVFQPLRAGLFRPEAIALVDEVKLGNAALQKVLRLLLLSKESKGRDRGFISYVELGINQLGAVYEGLMSYTGFFAETDLFEVARNGDATKGSWVVPIERADGITADDFVKVEDEVTGERVPVIHERGSFVFRLSGRERQQSASYYTPEVLTRFTVGQALEELLDQDGRTTTAAEILRLTICEPALGSGAFAIEAVRQLAAQYLSRRQHELGSTISPEDYPLELQRVKASIALHQVYGVDLNATAVEFAEIALWLDTMAAGLQAPWFGLHLRRGNSLIGARRAVYTRDQISSKAWLDTAPTDVPLTDIAMRVTNDDSRPTVASGRVPHWLLPAKGWGATADSKEAKQLAPERTQRVKDWRRSVIGKPTKTQLDALVEIGYQAEELWIMAYRRMLVAEQQSHRTIAIWGRDDAAATSTVSREQIETSLADPNGAYQRLRRVMDAWCALWFWPLTGDEAQPPKLAEWINACQQILGKDAKARNAAALGAATLAPDDAWQALADQEDLAIKGAGGRPMDEVLATHPWLSVCERVASEQGFFHWQLDFATAFGRGGFDLQVGNPPWVRPNVSRITLLAEGDPWWALSDLPKSEPQPDREVSTIQQPGMETYLISESSVSSATLAYLDSAQNYPLSRGLGTDLYRCFIPRTWAHAAPAGIIALLHPEGIFGDTKGAQYRAAMYWRLRRHWAFRNQLRLFEEVGNTREFGICVYGSKRGEIGFSNAVELYHPDTVLKSLKHDGSGPEPGSGRHNGTWDTRPHAGRIQFVDDEMISKWDMMLGSSTPGSLGRMASEPTRSSAKLMLKFMGLKRFRLLGLSFSRGWQEKGAKDRALIRKSWGVPRAAEAVILQSAQIGLHNTYYQYPNQGMASHRDYTPVDLEQMPNDSLPATSYKPACDMQTYIASHPTWGDDSPLNHYRIAWSEMVDTEGERSLTPTIIPPRYTHVHSILSAGNIGAEDLVLATALAGSLVSDYFIRKTVKGHIDAHAFESLPLADDFPLRSQLILRTLRLNSLTSEYSQLWEFLFRDSFREDSWALEANGAPALGLVPPQWSMDIPLRRSIDRRRAIVEIDALVALSLGFTQDELCSMYLLEFDVLSRNDKRLHLFDARGRLVPSQVRSAWQKKGDRMSDTERSHTNTSGYTYIYELPFRTYDREEDMRTAYAEFERRMQERP